MGKLYPIELREWVVAFVGADNTHRASASQFQVSIKFVNDMVRLKRESGSLQAKRQGNPGRGKLSKLHGSARLLQEAIKNSDRPKARSATSSQNMSALTSSKQLDTKPIKRDELWNN